MTDPARRGPTMRVWIATIVLILLVLVVWKFIDYRTQPPPPANEITTEPKS